jgi:CheY-like chemotaxis protein
VGIKILLADDSLTAQNMGKKILSEAGHEVVTVSNGAAAAKKIAELKPELVLLDVFMPGYSGLELCEKLRNAADTAKLPVLLTVGKMEPYSPQEGARVKADGVIIKPFEASDLTSAVERLAQKLKPASAPAPSHENTMKMAPPAEFKDESYLAWKQDTPTEGEESQSGPPSKAYEQTMRLDASQIAAMLKVADKSEAPAQPAHAEEFIVAAPAHTEEEFSVAPPAPSFSTESEASAPAFGSELAETTPSEVPSYMAQYLADQSDDLPVAPAASTPVSGEQAKTKILAFEAPLAREASYSSADAPTVVLPKESVVQHFEAPTIVVPSIASAEGLELTAAAPVDVPVSQEAGFEPTHQTSDPSTVVLPDPAFISDPHRSTMDFVTQFGTQESSGLAEQLLQSMGSPSGEKVSEDDFEARLNSAMTAFENPSAELPTPADSPLPSALIEMPVAAPTAEISAEPASFLIVPEPQVAAVEEVAAALQPQVMEAAIEAEAPVAFSQAAEAPPVSSLAPEELVEAAVQIPEAPLPSFTPEFAAVAIEPHGEPASIHAVSSTVVESAPPPETDDAVIRQMREAFSDLPVDHSPMEQHESEREPGPMAMAAAAAAAPAAVPAPPAVAREAELEIARALSAAVGAETPSDVTSVATTSEATPQSDSNSVAAAVENVMKRELPNLVWKIMAELDLRKRS